VDDGSGKTHTTGTGSATEKEDLTKKNISIPINGKEWLAQKKSSLNPYMQEKLYKTFGNGGTWVGGGAFEFQRDTLTANQLEPPGFKPLEFPNDLFTRTITNPDDTNFMYYYDETEIFPKMYGGTSFSNEYLFGWGYYKRVFQAVLDPKTNKLPVDS
jgi:hypothetical protein